MVTRFIPGEVRGPTETWVAGIDSLCEDDYPSWWRHRIQCFGHTQLEAVALRDAVLDGMAAMGMNVDKEKLSTPTPVRSTSS